jgi:hypothetical protein
LFFLYSMNTKSIFLYMSGHNVTCVRQYLCLFMLRVIHPNLL